MVSLFALLNKVAGCYGMLAVILSGGAALSQPLGQLTMYLYSIGSLVGFIWGLQKISEVRPSLRSSDTLSSRTAKGSTKCSRKRTGPQSDASSPATTGERRQDAEIRPPLCRRPPRRHRLHRLLCRRVVRLRPARRQTDRQLGSAKGHDGRLAVRNGDGRRGPDGRGDGRMAE